MKLPIRSNQQISESHSVKILYNLIPDEWVINQVYKDYGIDFEIDIWYKNKPTHKKLSLQVKRTTLQPTVRNIIKIKIKESTINYLNTKENPFIFLFDRWDNLWIYSTKNLIKLYGRYIKNGVLQLPIVLLRPFNCNRYKIWHTTFNPTRKIIIIVAGLNNFKNYLKYFCKQSEVNENYYSINIQNSDDDFWTREDYANFGYYISTRKGSKEEEIKYLKSELKEANIEKQRGIIEAFCYLNYSDSEVEKIALDMIKSQNSQDILIGLKKLGISKEEKYIQILGNYLNLKDIIQEFKKSLNSNLTKDHHNENRQIDLLELEKTRLFTLSKDEDFNDIYLTVYEAFSNINTPQTIEYLINLFLSEVPNPKEISFLGGLIKSKIPNWYKFIKRYIISVEPKIKIYSKDDLIEFISNRTQLVLDY
jgi:hypothetical protein